MATVHQETSRKVAGPNNRKKLFSYPNGATRRLGSRNALPTTARDRKLANFACRSGVGKGKIDVEEVLASELPYAESRISG